MGGFFPLEMLDKQSVICLFSDYNLSYKGKCRIFHLGIMSVLKVSDFEFLG